MLWVIGVSSIYYRRSLLGFIDWLVSWRFSSIHIKIILRQKFKSCGINSIRKILIWEIFKLTFKTEFAEEGLPLRAAPLSLWVLELWIANQIFIITTEPGHIVLLSCYFCQKTISAASLRRHCPLTLLWSLLRRFWHRLFEALSDSNVCSTVSRRRLGRLHCTITTTAKSMRIGTLAAARVPISKISVESNKNTYDPDSSFDTLVPMLCCAKLLQ